MSKFFTNKGWLTPYAMACGYMHVSQKIAYKAILSMNNAELNTYDVIVHFTNPETPRIWETVETIQAARDLYIKLTQGKPCKRARKPHEPETMPKIVFA